MTKHRLSWNGNTGDALCEPPTGSELFVRLGELFREEVCFLNPGLRMEQICQRLQATPASLLKALKKQGFRNFSHFVNHHRIEAAKYMMASEAYDIYTLEAIANMAGFGTRQAFYDTFERLSGMKPACYRRQVKGQAIE
jgi:AraC-like DNA-binding protein